MYIYIYYYYFYFLLCKPDLFEEKESVAFISAEEERGAEFVDFAFGNFASSSERS